MAIRKAIANLYFRGKYKNRKIEIESYSSFYTKIIFF